MSAVLLIRVHQSQGNHQLLQACRQGDEHALEKLTPQIYRELHLALYFLFRFASTRAKPAPPPDLSGVSVASGLSVSVIIPPQLHRRFHETSLELS
jgi:hypothetical protein